jgi:hypothetical protein
MAPAGQRWLDELRHGPGGCQSIRDRRGAPSELVARTGHQGHQRPAGKVSVELGRPLGRIGTLLRTSEIARNPSTGVCPLPHSPSSGLVTSQAAEVDRVRLLRHVRWKRRPETGVRRTQAVQAPGRGRRGGRGYQKYVAAEVVRQWSDLLEFNPEQAARMLDQTPEEYRCVCEHPQTFARAPLTPARSCCHLTPWQKSVQAGGHRLYQGHRRPG